MATSSTDLGVIYNHPSIISSITNNDTIFTSSTGTRPFFCVTASEKGVDNEIKMVTDVDEFLFKYGNPNLKLYGQGSYNIINVLNNNEAVYVMRVLPDNAGFSHAFLNIQTGKIGTKNVLNVEGKPVAIADIAVRPTITFTDVNNASLDLLSNEMDKNTGTTTVDGFENNILFYVVPEGRGKYYDKYGFRIYLNTSYDETYDFRVYNFEVIEYDDYDNASIIEGPFYVSFDPDALSASNESMFIEDVVNKYSDYVRVHFNEKAYNRIASIINDSVAPSHLDLLTGQTRVYDGEKENFFCNETMNYEDIHIYIQKYDSDGKLITSGGDPVTNIVDSDDTIQKSILTMDNSIRKEDYNSENIVLSYMKDALLKTYNSTKSSPLYNALFDSEFTNNGDESVPTTFANMNDLYNKYKVAYTTYMGDKTNTTNYSKAYQLSTKLEDEGIDPFIAQCKKIMAYANLFASSKENTLLINSDIIASEKQLNANEVVSIKLLNYKSVIQDYETDLITTKSLEDLNLEIENVVSYLATIATIISYLATNIGSSDPDLVKLVTDYTKAVSTINMIKSGYISDDDARSMMNDKIYGENNNVGLISKIFNEALVLIQYASLYVETQVMNNLFNTSVGALGKFIEINTIIYPLIKEVKTEFVRDIDINKESLIDEAKNAIDIEKTKVTNKKSSAYTIQLQGFSTPIRFENGSDGDLDSSSSNRTATLENLLIKGYKGLIDSNLTNRKTCPVRFILDANYSANIKNAIHILVTEIRQDIIFYCDLGFTSSPEGALAAKAALANFSSNKISIYGQDFTVYDEYTGRDIKVTVPYFLATKIPYNSKTYGLQYPIAGNKRGIIDGFKSISWTPNETYKELLYNNKINYIEKDTKRTKFGSQLTSEARTTPLSNINNVITVLDIKNDVEDMSEDYIFEFNNNDTINTFQNELNDYLATYANKKAVERVVASVYASDYDKLQKIFRVSIEIKFYDIIERIVINLDVVKQ